MTLTVPRYLVPFHPKHIPHHFVDVLDHFEYVGIAGYLWLRGHGAYSLDSYVNRGKLAVPSLRRYSLSVYRVAVGIGLATLALTEKLFNVTISQAPSAMW